MSTPQTISASQKCLHLHPYTTFAPFHAPAPHTLRQCQRPKPPSRQCQRPKPPSRLVLCALLLLDAMHPLQLLCTCVPHAPCTPLAPHTRYVPHAWSLLLSVYPVSTLMRPRIIHGTHTLMNNKHTLPSSHAFHARHAPLCAYQENPTAMADAAGDGNETKVEMYICAGADLEATKQVYCWGW